MGPRNQDKQRLIERFGLVPHPEGGHYRETHRDSVRVARILGPVSPGHETSGISRSASTCIYYMLCDGAYSAWHRIRSDEVWHFYAGDPIDVHVIDASGQRTTHRLGNALVREDANFQVVVPAGCWFAAECPALGGEAESAGFAFVGCTVAPGFEFSDFELAEVERLAAEYPTHAAVIRRLGPRKSA
ncbi:cupin domain-containing protein [Trinickia dinghuensis]|uniref:Cupin domain-containing protein n=1 Tax=Trinickia dinghuensis TaxID=2291023 RepID=A0A3D8JUX4_9BURK|nr:cupin domain-containing protein [Trinickia dinghuensis]RDU96650.1 cupin domain-containing protein [Trinickia dinghuensis]